ncbi:hypothetical protein D3C85_1777550 [compost metagenome]
MTLSKSSNVLILAISSHDLNLSFLTVVYGLSNIKDKSLYCLLINATSSLNEITSDLADAREGGGRDVVGGVCRFGAARATKRYH